MVILRWLAVIPAAVLGWYLALILGVLIHQFATRLCPAEKLLSGLCTAPWYEAVERAIFLGSVALSALLVVAFAAGVAPARKCPVALIALTVGAAVATMMAYDLKAGAELAAAISAGALATWILCRRATARTDDA